MIELLSTPTNNVVFERKNNLEPFFQKRNIPVNKIEYANTVYNTLTYGFYTQWQTYNNDIYIDDYDGVVSNCKFYYGDQRPDTLLSWQDNYTWKIKTINYFKCNYTGKHYFASGGSGQLLFYLASASSPSSPIISSTYSMSFENQSYYISSANLTNGNEYVIYSLYTPEQQKEYGFAISWQTDSASLTPEYQLLGGEQFSPYDLSGYKKPSFTEISYVNNVKYTENEDGKSILTFEVPFISSTSSYTQFGYYYDDINKKYIEKISEQELKEYRMIKYSEGYRNSQNEDELITKFTGQIRKIDKKYKANGNDTLFITCYDYSVFLKDSVNLSAPTKLDYVQAGYLTKIPGKVNGNLKPRTFDGWAIYKAYEILLTEAGICNSSFYDKKQFIDFYGSATVGGYIIEPLSNNIKEYLPTNKNYGLDPIGKIGGGVDDKYAYSIGTGEYWFDAIDKIMKPWYYKWGFNPNGNPYLKSINAPNGYVNSSAFSVDAHWTSSVHPRAFSGDFLISNYNASYKLDTANLTYFNVSDTSDAHSYYGETGQQEYINCYGEYSGRSDILSRTATTVLAITPATNYAEFNYSIRMGYTIVSSYNNPSVVVSIYSTSASITTFSSASWIFLSSSTHLNLPKYNEYNFTQQVTDAHIPTINSLCFIVDLTVGTGLSNVQCAVNPEYILYQQSAVTYNLGAIASCNATGKKFALLVGAGPIVGTSSSIETMKITISKDDYIVSETYYNPYNKTDHFYFDGVQNNTGVNPSYVLIANGLPYDEYNIKVESIDSSYPVYLEGLLTYDQDLDSPIEIFYTGDSQHKGNISTLTTKTEYNNQRNEAIVIGKRTGTLFYLDDNGNEIAVNPENETSVYIQSATRDLSSIYDTSASNFVGHVRNTIITDPSIITQHQADFISYSVVNDYGAPKESAHFSMIGNPKLQPGDCIAVVDDFKYGIDSANYLWITKVENTFSKIYKTTIETSPIKPISSFWSIPDIDIDTLFDGYHIWNLTIYNGGWDSNLTSYLSTTATNIYIDSSNIETYVNTLIPHNGYCLVGREIIHYDSVDAGGSTLRLTTDKRGLGEEGIAYSHSSGDSIIIGYNPYSKSQLAPMISFDLLKKADVEIDIYNHVDISKTNNIVISEYKIDSLTNVSKSPIKETFESKEIGHYNFYWGGYDRIGNYNNNLRTEDEGKLYPAQYFARSNYKLSYSSANQTQYYNTAYGMYYAVVKVVPRDEPNSIYKYYSNSSGVSYLKTQGNQKGIIKQFLMDPGTVNLSFSTSGMYYAEDLNNYWYYVNFNGDLKYYTSPPTDYMTRQGYCAGNLLERPLNSDWYSPDLLTNASTYPYIIKGSSSVGVFITNASNEINGNSQGLIFHITDEDVYDYEDIQRVFIPSIQCYIRQFAFFVDDNNVLQTFKKDTIIPLSEAQKIDRITSNSNLHINPKELSQDGKISFIPNEVQTAFQNNATSSTRALVVSNIIFFDNNLVDLSGRRVKQKRSFTALKNNNSVCYNFDLQNFSNKQTWSLDYHYLAYLLMYVNSAVPYTFGTPTNQGFYEYIDSKEKDYYWQYYYYFSDNINSQNVTTIDFKSKFTWEYASYPQESGARIIKDSLGTSTTDVSGYLKWETKPKNRISYITWIDNNLTTRIMNFNMNYGYNKYVINNQTDIFNNYLTNYNTFTPNVWAVFLRKDFG